jgi:universal stress protein E
VAASHEGVKTGCAAIWGKPIGDMIIAKTIETKADLVIKDMHQEPALRRIMHTPLDWQLLRLCPAPLMLVHPDAHPETKRVVAAVDPMEIVSRPHDLNDRILQTTLALARLTGAAPHTVYAFEHLPPAAPDADIGGSLTLGYIRMLELTEQAHREAFDRLMDQYQVPPDRRHFLSRVFADKAIGEFVHRELSDLLVIGAVYRSGYEKLMLGSTAERILYHVDCDVLVVKSKAFTDDVVSKYGGELEHAIDYGKLAA